MADMPDRRRVARLVLPSHLRGQLLGSQEVRILDLSPIGVRIEHVEPVRPGASCILEFPPPLGPVQLTARVVWSLVRGAEQTPEGERRLHYQSGLAFIGVTAEQQAVLADALEKINTTGGEKIRKPPL
jgi:hypothetical protein